MDLDVIARRMRELRATAVRQAVDTRRLAINRGRVVDASEIRREPSLKTVSSSAMEGGRKSA